MDEGVETLGEASLWTVLFYEMVLVLEQLVDHQLQQSLLALIYPGTTLQFHPVLPEEGLLVLGVLFGTHPILLAEQSALDEVSGNRGVVPVEEGEHSLLVTVGQEVS